MITVAEVRLWGKRVGAVSITEDSPYAYFQYDDDFLNSHIQLSPIVMPLSNIVFQFSGLPLDTFKGLPGLLSDSLPDRYGTKIIDAWLDAQGRSRQSFTVVERLCYVGTRGMGALEYYPAKHKEYNRVEEIELNDLVNLSNEIINQKAKIKVDEKAGFEEIIKVGTSAGGARAKAIIAYNEKTGIIKSGQIDAGEGFTYWIIKLDGVNQGDETAFTRREYAYYLMAKEAKIEMTESRLLEKDGYYHFMTRRFDRYLNSKNKMEKLHMQTLGALTHIDYNQPGSMSYEETANIMYRLGIQPSANKQLFRRMVFNVMSRNHDDHVKNISFLMDKAGKWSLAPAYDITYSYNPDGQWTNKHQMTINAKRENITIIDLLQAAQNMKIKSEDALAIINEVRSALLKWESFAKKAFLKQTEIDFIRNQFIFYK
ncbi:MAG TPA: type II toxin-antitoxin system HipA family toxin [Bacilli bacterium]|nr:type II toxin-antitoxin system HipA family toxin [Bacilli bacterium]